MRKAIGCLLLAACQTPGQVDESKLVDLTYAFDEETIYWPTGKAFHLEQKAWGINDRGWWYASNDLSGSEHGGTHLDAPIHFARGRSTTTEIPLRQLVGPVRVIDIREQCEADRDYALSVNDVWAHEAVYGEIPKGSIVLVHTGWGEFWGNQVNYLGSAEKGTASDLHFPGIGGDAAEVFVQRQVDLVGIDTASLDPGQSKDFPAHRVLAQADIPGLENVAQLERLPVTGATVFALPMKIAGGTGGPCRIIAVLP